MTRGNIFDKIGTTLKKDTFALIWIIFIVAIVLLTYYGKHYVKDMVVVSIMFLAILALEPLVHMAHGSKITKIISGGRHVPAWKRFPIFFVAILLIFALKHFLEVGLDYTFPTHSVNIVFVAFWLAALFLLYLLIFSKKAK